VTYPVSLPVELDSRVSSLRAACGQRIEQHFGFRPTVTQLRQLEQAASRELGPTTPEPISIYNTLLAATGTELLDRLVGELTIGETHFFRVGPQIQALQQIVLPELIARRSAGRRLRCWSAGCSSGEEPYTLAILLREALQVDHWSIELLATDLNAAALEQARQASYGEWSFRDTPDWVRQRYFNRDGRRWRLAPEIRQMVRFAVANLAAELPPFIDCGPWLDLIVCRNVTIYFTPETTARLYTQLAELLTPGGWLILGPSDPTPERGELLEPLYLPGAVLWRRVEPRQSVQAAHPTSRLPAVARRVARTAMPLRPGRRSAASRPASAPRPEPEPAGGGLPIAAELDRIRELEGRGERAAARELAHRLTTAHPQLGAAHLLFGLLSLELGECETALLSLRRATFLDCRDPLAQFGLAQAYLAQGQSSRARAALNHARRLLALAPDATPLSGLVPLCAAELRPVVAAQLANLGYGAER
jgi:chemotaxis protein methyltransferase CheR